MKKIWMMMAMVAIFTACSSEEELDFLVGNYTLTGYADVESRTAFGAPESSSIPFVWSVGDKIWAGTTQSNAIATYGKSATFTFASEPTGTVYYNMTGSSAQAKVKASQKIGDLGTNGDFGYGTINDGSFTLSHATAYLWFNVTSSISGAILETIKVNADGSYIAGEAYWNGSSFGTVTDASSIIELTVGQTLTTTNNNVWAMVVLPANLQGKTVKVTYKLTVNNATKYYTQTLSGKNLPSGTTQKITANIANNDLTDYAELRVLTFEDDITFEEYSFLGGDEIEYNITKWSDLIVPEDEQNYAPNGNIIYANFQSYIGTEYYWEDSNNTKLYHKFPENYGMSNYAGGGAAVSSHTVDFSDLTKDEIYNYQVSVTCGGGNNGSSNFCVAYNASEVDYVEAELTKNTLEFSDGVPRVIDHMYVTIVAPTHYCITKGNDFSEAFDDDDYLKLVATGIKEDGTKKSLEIMLAEGADYKLTDWTKWDLSSLGKVKAIEFHMEEAQKVSYTGANGPFYYKTPLYFAFDDIAVRFE